MRSNKHAYDLFAQEAKSARTSYSGSGLGLAIVKKTVELLNGEVSYVSEESKGTTFTVKLTLQNDKDRKEQPKQRIDSRHWNSSRHRSQVPLIFLDGYYDAGHGWYGSNQSDSGIRSSGCCIDSDHCNISECVPG